MAPLAALGTRVPEPAPSFEEAHAAGFQDGYAAAENAGLASETERIQALVDMAMERPERYPELMARVRDLSGRDAYPMMSPSGSFNTSDRMTVTGASVWNPSAMLMERLREVSRRELGLPLDRPATDAEIAAMARRDRERGA